MKTTALYARALLLALFCTGGSCALAGEIGDELRAADSGNASKNGGFLEVGAAMTVQQSIYRRADPTEDNDISLNVGLSISAGYRYERLFFEASESGFNGLNFGVVLLENDRWRADLLLANISGHISIESEEPPIPSTEDERNDAILSRDSLFVAAGARLTGYFGDNLVQLHVVSDWHDDNGVSGSARVGRQWQVGNWNVQAIGGARYYSQQFNNYLYGVSAEEQSQRFTQYVAGNAWIPEFEVGASLPLKKNWVYSSRLRYRHYPNSVTNSPLIANDADVILTSAIHYVF